MDKETLRKVQLVQLEIAKEIKRVCDKNGISYFLDGGTFLGAVRHGGFIPWDDDLDVGMLRPDYEKFMKIAPGELDEKYFLQNSETDENYGLAFAKVRKNNTLYQESANEMSKCHKGIFVDIFPYDNLPDDKSELDRIGGKLKNIKRVLLMKSRTTPWKTYKGMRKYAAYAGYIPYRAAALFQGRDKINLKIKKTVNMCYNSNGQYYGCQAETTTFGSFPIPKRCLDNLEEMKFEDDYFKVPSDFDQYLKIYYGDYMKLPPVEARQNYHGVTKVEL